MVEARIHNNKIEIFTSLKDKARELQAEFSALEPHSENNIRVRSGQWDGLHKFYTLKSGKEGFLFTIPIGFLGRTEEFLGVKLAPKVTYDAPRQFLKEIIPKLPFKPYRHQLKFFLEAASRDVLMGVSATSSGKSLVIALLVKYFYPEKSIFIVVPSVSLVHQMYDDIIEVFPEFKNKIQQLGGEFKNKDITKDILISTYQSAIKVPLKFDVCINDEAHLAKAETLQTILSNPFKIKIGLTGTLPLEKLEFMKIEKNFGNPLRIINARGLIDLGLATSVTIVPIFLSQKVPLMNYHEEIKFMKRDPLRKEWINKFLKKLKGPTIALYAHTEHGLETFTALSGISAKDKNNFDLQKEKGFFFLSGSTNPKTRRAILEYFKTTSDNIVMVAQVKIMSTGISIKPLKNLVFLSSSKSNIQVLQSIGRVLRLHKGKLKALVFDLIDDYTGTKKKRKTENHQLRHAWTRIGYYESEGFEMVEKEIILD